MSVEYCATIFPFSHLTTPSAQALSLPESAVSKSIAVNVSKYSVTGGFLCDDFMSDFVTLVPDCTFLYGKLIPNAKKISPKYITGTL